MESGGRLRWEIAHTWAGRPAAAGERASVELAARGDDLRLVVEAPFHGDPPPAGPPGPTPRLWEHEVVELFVAGGAAVSGETVGGEGGDAAAAEYLEIELGPHGHHLVLRLRGVRRVVEEGLALDYRAEIAGGRWRGEALLPRAWLPPPPHRADAFALHGPPQARRHLAATPLPGDRPDFHQPARFPAVRLPGRGHRREL